MSFTCNIATKSLIVKISDFLSFSMISFSSSLSFFPLLCVLDFDYYLGGFLNRSVMLEICTVWNRLYLQIRVRVRE